MYQVRRHMASERPASSAWDQTPVLVPLRHAGILGGFPQIGVGGRGYGAPFRKGVVLQVPGVLDPFGK